MATISDLCGAQITRSTLMNCARSAKRQGNDRDMRHFVRGAKRWHAKVKRIIAAVPAAELARFYGWGA